MKQTRRNFLQWLFGLFPFLTGLFGLFQARGGVLAERRVVDQSSSPALTLLIFGDWGRGGEFHQRDVTNQMGLAAAKRRCRFFVCVGDDVYGICVQVAA